VLPTASPETAVGPRRRRASANFGPHGQFPAAATPDLALYRRHGFTVLAAGVVAQRLARLDHTTGRSPGRSRGWINRLPQLANFARAPTDGMDDVRRVVTERVPRRQPRWINCRLQTPLASSQTSAFRGRPMPIV